MGVSKNSGIPKWMVYNGKPYQNGWFGGTTIFGNIHIGFEDPFILGSCIWNIGGETSTSLSIDPIYTPYRVRYLLAPNPLLKGSLRRVKQLQLGAPIPTLPPFSLWYDKQDAPLFCPLIFMAVGKWWVQQKTHNFFSIYTFGVIFGHYDMMGGEVTGDAAWWGTSRFFKDVLPPGRFELYFFLGVVSSVGRNGEYS